MKAKTTFFSMALLIAFLLLGCSNDESGQGSSSLVPGAPTGDKIQYLTPGSTVSQISVQGTNVKWYLNLRENSIDQIDADDLIEVNYFSGMALLSSTAQVRNSITYYATQTVNRVQSRDFLAVTVYCGE